MFDSVFWSSGESVVMLRGITPTTKVMIAAVPVSPSSAFNSMDFLLIIFNGKATPPYFCTRIILGQIPHSQQNWAE
jgi:hypothetical protein